MARFEGLPAGAFRAQGYITCGSEELPVNGDVAGGLFGSSIDLDQMGGNCSLSVALNSTLTPDPYGLPSPQLTAAFSIGTAAAYRFKAVTAGGCRPQCSTLAIDVSYLGEWLV